MSQIGLVFLGHGTKNDLGIQEFREFSRRVEHKLQNGALNGDSTLTCALAFLERTQPDLPTTFHAFFEQGVYRIVLVPLFLFAAGHIKQDIPSVVTELVTMHAPLSVQTLDPVGFNRQFIKVVMERLQDLGDLGDARSGVLLLGRGNRDADAQGTFERVAQQVRGLVGLTQVEVGYLAGNGRDWRQALDTLVQSGCTQIYIQPYLWFHGWLTEQLPRWVMEWGHKHPNIKSVVGMPLGVHPLLIDEIVSRVQDFFAMM